MTLELMKVIADYASLLVSVTALLISLGFAFSNRGSARRKDVERLIADGDDALEEDLEKLRIQVTGIDSQVGQLAVQVRHLPSHDDLQKIHGRISEVKNSVSAVAQAVSGLSAASESTSRSLISIQTTLQQLVDNELAEGRAAKNRRSEQ